MAPLFPGFYESKRKHGDGMARFSFSHREPELLFSEGSIPSKENTFLVLRKKEEEAVLQEMSKNLHIDVSIGKSAWYSSIERFTLFLYFNVYYFTINSLQSAVCGLQSAVCSLQSAVCSLQSANVIHREK